MKPQEDRSQKPTEDRAALREELLRAEANDRLRMFDALNREADPDDEEVPEMPEELRDQLVEQFGDRTPREVTAPRATPVSGWFARMVEFFQAKPLSAYGGLAAAACAVMFMMLQTAGGPDGTGPRKTDHVRGDKVKPSATAEVPVYLFPASKAAEVVELANQGREFVLCADRADFDSRRSGKWVVAVDLDRRVVMSFGDGEATGEVPIDREGAAGVLLAVRAALDEMVD